MKRLDSIIAMAMATATAMASERNKAAYLVRVVEIHFVRLHLRVAERRGSARNDGDLEERVGVLKEPPRNGVARLVVRHSCLLRLGEHTRLLFEPADDTLDGRLELHQRHSLLGVARSDQRRLIAHVGDIRSCTCNQTTPPFPLHRLRSHSHHHNVEFSSHHTNSTTQ
jgi:hypothetical protein